MHGKIFAISAAFALAACAQQTPVAIQGEVILNKYGQPSGCVDGQYIPGASYDQQCYPPQDYSQDGCEETANGCIPFRDPEYSGGMNSQTPPTTQQFTFQAPTINAIARNTGG